jgi:hypothetical protein
MQFGASTFIWVSPFSNKTLGLIKKVREMGFDIIEICIEDLATIDAIRISDEPSFHSASRCMASARLSQTVTRTFEP